MTNFSKYKLIAFVLATVFAVFNIGLPIVLASCPMMKDVSSQVSCCPVTPEANQVAISTYNDFSCCVTVIAADRNTTEFLQTKDNLKSALQYSSTPILQSVSINIFNHNQFTFSFSAPPSLLVEDIPIFTSSLLI